MENLFEAIDKSGRMIRFPQKQWKHILQDHPEIAQHIEEIKIALQRPLKITTYSFDNQVRYYYTYIKQREGPAKYLLVIVKYLNGTGYIITAYFEKKIQ
ncbi:hypothetical protein HYS50_00805 [Candidatus Woesearchaeota archaeon]|nr:hypothetical protein [Candidatus Woesearchaeota archaeon]